MRKKIFKKTLLTFSLILIAIISVFVVADIVASPEMHTSSIRYLDKKKIEVAELTVATAAASIAVSAIPGDATTPIANQIANMSTYLMMVVAVIFLEKILLTITGHIAFSFIVPVACFLFIISFYKYSEFLKIIAVKLLVFGLLICSIVPISVNISKLVEYTVHTSATVQEAIHGVDDIENDVGDIPQNYEEEHNWVKNLWKKVKSTFVKAVGVAKGTAEKILNKFIDAVATLIVTACVIPLGVMMCFIKLIKWMFGIEINTPKIKNRNIIKKSSLKKIEKQSIEV